MNARNTWHWVALGLFLGVSGCSGSDLVSASGRVTYKGQPVPSTLVKFVPDDGSRRSTGITDDAGNFTLRFSRTENGVKRGGQKVILKYEPSGDEELGKSKPKASRELQAIIAKYNDLKKTTLHYEVTTSGQSFEIEIK
jgi:hypothetical protein